MPATATSKDKHERGGAPEEATANEHDEIVHRSAVHVARNTHRS
jgi:hypothetical protein